MSIPLIRNSQDTIAMHGAKNANLKTFGTVNVAFNRVAAPSIGITKKQALATALLALFLFMIETAWAVPAYIDRTKRTIDVPTECLNAPVGINNVSYNNGHGVNLANVDARFTLVLSTTARLQARLHNTALDLSWYNFDPGNAQYNLNLNHTQRLVRAVTLARCGLPVTPGDRNLYQYPANLNAFITFAMGDGGAEARLPTGYTLVGNGEREALLMYAAQRIKFDLTPVIVRRNQVCLLYSRANAMSGCTVERTSNSPRDTLIGYLYEGMHRISYTGHEFWMMFSIDAYRNKVFFTSGDQIANGNTVDNFLVWNNVSNNIIQWRDINGVQTNYPGTPYQFQGIYDANNNSRNLFQNLLPAFINHYDPHILTYSQF